MTPPISIDGTDIIGATIDGQDVEEITVDGQTVFSAGPDIPDSGVAFWNWEETATDSWGNFDATLDGPIYDSGQVAVGSYSIEFDGTNDYVEFPTSLGVNHLESRPWSISIWIRAHSFPSPQTAELFILDFRQGFDDEIRWVIKDEEELACIHDDDSVGALETTYSSFDLTTWYHLVITASSTTQTMYIDGNSVDTVNISNHGTLDLSSGGYLGNRIPDSNYSNYFDGEIDDMKVFDKVLSSAEVSNLYNNNSIL